MVHVARLIRWGMTLSFPRRKFIVVLFRYEKLPNFYYLCGCLNHIVVDCKVLLSNIPLSTPLAKEFGP